ncbi:hypothetical protein CXB51_022346 [Gossypium anomalum]|uniref:Kinesin motor domain-containing protein n=1 Tax=Gossypium anomalum TaxID=47600 RepID=A0A8J5YGZ9_9ROSI|nr:hypothetical protein CXB51_022346 [Gossypium anomalum]
MSRDVSSFGFISKNANENDFETSSSSAHFPPPRTPLNSIPDPSQYQKESRSQDEQDVVDSKDKSESLRALHKTPRVTNRHGKLHSESNSAQSTPSRTAPRFSLGGGAGPCFPSKVTQGFGGRCGLSSASSSRVPRRVSMIDGTNFSVEAPHFELVEDPSFWRDRNVQVLIRIRPLSTMERVSQGYGRCLKQESAQTLLWLGHAESRFTFDHVACETISQEKLFRVVGVPMVENCMSGYNSCMFAYGQTGSGKTYTMMGDIYEVESQLSEDCGLTPRIFEYLFSRIRMEERGRKDEKLRFSCKCSFLEIYNEQITDLLDPSSTNLQRRLEERLRAAVPIVFSLVSSKAIGRRFYDTSDLQVVLNTKIIGLKFRQKSSGAEGDRLKEAAKHKQISVNSWKVCLQCIYFMVCCFHPFSLVIMSLVDLAHGKHRHVPYRDSRLTFLLQDSLGGNSKTTMIANVSPSICAANETLSTLKFAQRASLFRIMYAKVNEDASGDVNALQQQIEQLKGQLSSLLKHHNFPNSPNSCVPSYEELKIGDYSRKNEYTSEKVADCKIQNINSNKMRRMEATLAGSLRREKMAETANQKLEAEIEQMNRLNSFISSGKAVTIRTVYMGLLNTQVVSDRFAKRKKMFSVSGGEDKNLESLATGLVSTEEYLMEENQALKAEIQLLRTKIDRNPELTRFALENIRLIEQLQIFQNFYEQGEREILLGEISDCGTRKDRFSSRYENQVGMHYHIIYVMNGTTDLYFIFYNSKMMMHESQDGKTVKELEDCRNMNSKLMREVEELQMELSKYLNCSHGAFDSVSGFPSKDHKECRQTDKCSLMETILQVETISVHSDSGDEVASCSRENDVALENQNEQSVSVASAMQHSATQKELIEARLLLKAMEAEHIHLFNEMQHLQEENRRYMEMISNEGKLESESVHKLKIHCLELDHLASKKEGQIMESELINVKGLHDKLDILTKDLENAKLLNCQYQQVQASQLSCQHEADLVREQVEMETARTILHLQEEVAALQLELNEKLASITQENTRLRDTITAKEEEMKSICADWERATLELTSFLLDGSKSLKDASRLVENISCSFPQINVWVGENVERAARVCIEKEERILLLQRSLEDAQRMIVEMEMKLSSLKGATIAFNEFQDSGTDVETDEAAHLSHLFNDETDLQKVLANELKVKEDQLITAEKRANAAFLIAKWLVDCDKVAYGDHAEMDIPVATSEGMQSDVMAGMMAYMKFLTPDNLKAQVELAKLVILESENVINTSYEDAEAHLSTLKTDTSETCSVFKESLQDLKREILDMRSEILNIKENCKVAAAKSLKSHLLHQIKCEIAEANQSLKSIKDCIKTKASMPVHLPNDEDAIEKPMTEVVDDTKLEEVSLQSDSGFSESSGPFGLRNELWMQLHVFHKLYVWLTTILNESDIGEHSHTEELPSLGLTMEIYDAASQNNIEALPDDTSPAKSFFKKFEEAHATMKEADYALKALLKANENAQQASEELMVEKSNLIDELENLRYSISLKERENELLQDQIHYTLVETADSISLLEGCFKQMQRQIEDKFKVLYSDALSMCQEMLFTICNSRSSLEDICSEVIKKELSLFVLYHCHFGDFVHKTLNLSSELFSHPLERPELHSVINTLVKSPSISQGENVDHPKKSTEGEDGQLKRKEDLLEGLLFDLHLLQESASNSQEIKDESEKLMLGLKEVCHELEIKTNQVDDLLVQHSKLENRLSDSENALEQAKQTIDSLLDENAEMRVLLEDLYHKKSEAEEGLEEQKEVVKELEKEILHLNYSLEKDLLSSIKGIEEDLRKVTSDRDELREEIFSLNDQLEMVRALADENEAIAVEARQESEASKIYAEQKEEEVKLLEHSVEELESTVNVLEKKVYELDEEVERHRFIRISLEHELQFLRDRLSKVDSFVDVVHSVNSNAEQTEDLFPRQMHDKLLQLHEAHDQIRILEREKEELSIEIKQCKEYISEILLHSEAQASQYQQKYKTLEAMIRELKTDLPTSTSTVPISDKNEKTSTRSRGSSSPFRCISSLVQQMNSEKDQELSNARLRIEELEALSASRQKEIYMLNTRLAAAESMTHDVIRDLLGVKLDMTNYANLIDQHQVQKLLKEANQQAEEFLAKEQEILNLRKQLCLHEINKKDADILTAQLTLEQLQQRDQLLSAQNEMLKVAELDELITSSKEKQINQTLQIKENGSLNLGSVNLNNKRPPHSERLVSRMNNEMGQFRKTNGRLQHHDKTCGSSQGFDAKYR